MADCNVLILGAGLGGLGMAVQLKRQLGENDFEIYDKLDDVGGTWAQNRYPNLSCDVPSEFYSFSFFQNPDWSSKFSSQPEILAYIHECVRHFQLERHLRLQQHCTSLRWSDERRLWTASFVDSATGHAYDRRARFVVAALGVLSTPKGLDELPVLRDFKGPVFHTAEWREVDFQDKAVMVIGNGCSANQVVPWILNEAHPKKLVHVVRSEQWVAPKGDYKHGVFFRWVLRYVPLVMHVYRLWTAIQYDWGFRAFRTDRAGTRAREADANAIRAFMRSVAAPRYHSILIPKYDLGAKRPVVDHGYLAATNHEDFELVKCNDLRAIEGDGKTVVDSLGNRHETDIIVMANGFKTQDLLTPLTIYGKQGQELRGLWKSLGGAEAYMGVSMPNFPNFFMLTGPNTLPSGNSTLLGIECSIIYITRLMKHLKQYKASGTVTISPEVSAEREYNQHIQQQLKGLVYTKAVRSWYMDPETGKNTLIWPDTQTAFWWSRCHKAIDWQHWKIE